MKAAYVLAAKLPQLTIAVQGTKRCCGQRGPHGAEGLTTSPPGRACSLELGRGDDAFMERRPVVHGVVKVSDRERGLGSVCGDGTLETGSQAHQRFSDRPGGVLGLRWQNARTSLTMSSTSSRSPHLRTPAPLISVRIDQAAMARRRQTSVVGGEFSGHARASGAGRRRRAASPEDRVGLKVGAFLTLGPTWCTP